MTVDFEVSTGEFCNEATVQWADPMATSLEECVNVTAPFNGLVKGVDLNGDTDVGDPGELPGEGEDTVLVNLWLCADQSSDGIDNDGDSTVDNELNTCPDQFTIHEVLFTPLDCDTRNDDDDGDGLPVSNSRTIHADEDGVDNDGDTLVDEDGELAPANANGLDDDDDDVIDEADETPLDATPEVANPDFREECPEPTLDDFINGLVDKDGGELPEGLGAFEFQLKFDHKIFDIEITETDLWLPPDRAANCSMTIISENDIRFGCVSVYAPNGMDDDGDTEVDEADEGLGFDQVSGIFGASIEVSAEADLPFRIRPGKDNGVVRRLLDENCEVADIFGDIFPETNAGLTPDCTDVDITVRRLEGDLDMDCDVQVTDAQRIAFRYGSFFGQLLYDTFYDMEPFVTPDFDIDIKDLQFVFGRIGSTCDEPIPNNQDPISANGVGQP
jgi:hypothetical protein